MRGITANYKSIAVFVYYPVLTHSDVTRVGCIHFSKTELHLLAKSVGCKMPSKPHQAQSMELRMRVLVVSSGGCVIRDIKINK